MSGPTGEAGDRGGRDRWLQRLVACFDGRPRANAVAEALALLCTRSDVLAALAVVDGDPGGLSRAPLVRTAVAEGAPPGLHEALAAAALRADAGLRARVDEALPEVVFPEISAPAGCLVQSAELRHARGREGELLLVASREATDGTRRILEDAAAVMALCLTVDRLQTQLRLEVQERELLLETSRRVSRSLELEDVLEQVFDAVHRVVPFDAAVICLVEGDGSLRAAAQRGYDDTAFAAEIPPGRGIVGAALRAMQGLVVDDVAAHPDYLRGREATRSEMAVPIVSAGQAVGVLNLESDRPAAYSERDLRIAELLAAQVASAIVNARMHREQLERLKVERELLWAREIQVGLFPKGPPPTEAVEFDAINVPSSAVGGDYYDYMLLPDGRLWLVIADVSGHGLFASLLTAVMQTGFRLLARELADPAELAARLNALLHERTPANQYVAGVLGLLDLRSGELCYCNAGHLPPLAIVGGSVSELRGGGLPLGAFGDAHYERRSVRIEPGTLLVFYTDGIVEAVDAAGEAFGQERLLAALRAEPDTPIEHFVPRVRKAVRAFRGRRGDHRDDVTLMVIRFRGPAGGGGAP